MASCGKRAASVALPPQLQYFCTLILYHYSHYHLLHMYVALNYGGLLLVPSIPERGGVRYRRLISGRALKLG